MLKYQTGIKRYARLEDVHKCRKCSHRVTITRTVAGLEARCSQMPKMFTQRSGSLKRYAGLEDVQNRRKCSHRVTVTKTVRRAGRCSQTPKMFTQWSGTTSHRTLGKTRQVSHGTVLRETYTWSYSWAHFT